MDIKLRNMTSTYICQNGKVLLLYRVGSKVVTPSWCGVGGHFEKDELNDSKACALRELEEEIGITEDDLIDFKLRYIVMRLKDGEMRQLYYYFAELKSNVMILDSCKEGRLEWVDDLKIFDRHMPYTGQKVLQHYFTIGMYDENLYASIATKEDVQFTKLEEF